MKRKYFTALFIWLAIGLSVSGYFKYDKQKVLRNNPNSFFYEPHTYYGVGRAPDAGGGITKYRPQHGEIFFRATLIGACIILGAGFFDRPK